MRDALAHNGPAALETPAQVTHDLVERHRKSGSLFRNAALLCGALFILGVIGFVIRLGDGVSDTAVWGYYAALFAFILTTAQAAPIVAITLRIAKGHWRRPISRAAELFTAVGLLNLLLFIPLIWVLPSLEDGRRSLWFYGEYVGTSAYSPHIWATVGIVLLVVCGVALLWVSLASGPGGHQG